MVGLGIGLLLLGVLLFLVEAHVPTHGVLGAGAIGGVVAGAVVLVLAAGGGLAAGLAVAVVVTAVSLALLALALRRIAAARHGRLRAGPEAVLGHVGVVRSAGDGEARVFVDGTLWRAQPFELGDGPDRLRAGDHVVVEGRHGLTLDVRRADELEVRR
ncbi:MAG: serine protease [Actinomycetota bacterium]|nr:serine protease [Actinomycetota bacterium]